MQNIIKYIFDFVIIFGFLFQMVPGGIDTRRVCLFLAIIVLFFRYKKLNELLMLINTNAIKKAVWCLFICVFLLMINQFGNSASYSLKNEYFEIWYIAYLFLYVLVFPIFCLLEFEKIIDFARVYIGIFVVQFVAVMLSAISTPFRLALFAITYYGDDRFENAVFNGSRIVGIALHSSLGSITCSTCAILLAYLLFKKQIKYSLFLIFYGMVVATTLFIGRTGVIVEGVVLLYVLIMGGKHLIKHSIITIALFMLFTSYYTSVLTSMDSGQADNIVEWASAIFDKDVREETLKGVNRNTALPSFSSEFIFGTRVMGGITPGGAVISSDSGYVMIYSSLGIVGAFFYYFFFFILYKQHRSKNEDKKIRNFFIIITLCSFVVEYKEPFMLKYTMPFMIVFLALFERIERKKLIKDQVQLYAYADYTKTE